MRKMVLAVLLIGAMTTSACGAIDRVGATVGGRPTEHRMNDGVRCYESQTGSLSCVVLPR